MRRGWREILVVSLVFLLGTTVPTARSWAAGMRGEARVGLTIELRWSAAPGQAGDQTLAAPSPISDGLTLSLSDGEITEIIPWPADPAAGSPFKNADGAWMIGHLATSRVRARLEVPLSAEIIASRGEHSIRIPVSAVLERPQNAPAQAPFSISIERLPWDSLMVDFGQGAETGVVAPASDVPVAVKYNLLWPEVAEIAVRTTAVLRPMNGTEVLWKEEYREVVAANQLELVARTLNMPSPRAEGSYVLELSSSWEPSGGRESSTRIGRLIRRRKPSPVVASATRRLVLAVVDAKEKGPGGIPEGTAKETEVDSLDLGRIRTARYNAWGRSPVIMPPRHVWGIPAEIIQDAGKKDRDRLKNWIPRTVAETGSLGPADGEGLAWSAVGLRIPHPDKPHRVTLTVTGGDPSSLGVAIVDPGGTGRKPRILLDACASGPPVLANGPPVTFSYLVWPDTPEPLLVVLNRNASGPVRLGTVKVAEVESIAARTPIRPPNTPETRAIGVYLAGPNALDRFGGSGEAGLADSLEVARNLVSYLTYCGSSLVVLPERMADRQTRRALHGQADEDATGPDQFEIALRLLKRQGYLAWLAMNLSGTEPLPGLPPPGSPEALQRGLVRVDRNGLADGPCYNPLNAEVRAALRRRLEEAVAPPEGVPRVSGILLRLGSGPTLLGSPDTGIDDETFTRFVRETFGPGGSDSIPGLGHDDPERFAARAKYVTSVGRMPWLTWRSQAIAAHYAELNEAVHKASPQAVLALTTPALHDETAGVEARRVDLVGLAPSQAWRNVGLDFQIWPTAAAPPIVLRGVELSTDPLARDLAINPDLDGKVAELPQRGMLLTIAPETGDARLANAAQPPAENDEDAEAEDDGVETEDGSSPSRLAWAMPSPPLALSSLPMGDEILAEESLGHALAAIDAQWVILASSAISGHEDRIRGFATVLRALPAGKAETVGSEDLRKNHGVTVRKLSAASQTFLELNNDTPYPVRLAMLLDAAQDVSIDDMGRNLRLVPQAVTGGRQLVVDLPPFGTSAIRVGAAKVQVSRVTPYPSEAVLASLEAQFREVSSQLTKLNRVSAKGAGELDNPGFEPSPSRPIVQTQKTENDATPTVEAADPTAGWRHDGGTNGELVIDAANPHSGQGSLRLTATATPVSAISPNFVPGGSPNLTIRSYLRTEPADIPVRLWIQGEAGGQPFLRRTEFKVTSDWDLKAVKVTDLPAGGLDWAKLRFEMLGPGSLWVDDLKFTGEAAPRAVRLNAQRTLLAAIQAYRSGQYAEFARLSGSHWARHPSVLASIRSGTPDALTGHSKPRSDGSKEASALSPNSRLR